jgi:hypothetical protein
MTKVVVQQLIRNEHGVVCGIGNSYEVEYHEAENLVSGGEYKYQNIPLGSEVVKKSAKKAAKAEAEIVAEAEEIDG